MANEPEAAMRESCELALARIHLSLAKGPEALKPPASCPYVSIDPSPSFDALLSADKHKTEEHAQDTANESDNKNNKAMSGARATTIPTTVPELAKLLLDTTGQTSLFTRYMAMFSLRNLGTPEAITALTRALREDDVSALFRHEVAFVLGQLEAPSSQTALVAALRDEAEAPMVRHEAA